MHVFTGPCGTTHAAAYHTDRHGKKKKITSVQLQAHRHPLLTKRSTLTSTLEETRYLVSQRQRMRHSNIQRLRKLLLGVIKLTELIEADAQVGQREECQGRVVRERRQPLAITADLQQRRSR